MTVRRFLGLASVLATVVLVGCASAPERELSSIVPPYAVLATGLDPLTGEQKIR